MGLRMTNLRLAPGTSGEVGPLQAFFCPAAVATTAASATTAAVATTAAAAAAAVATTAAVDEAEPAAETTPKRQRTQQREEPEAYVEDVEGEAYVGLHARAEASGDAEGEAFDDAGVEAFGDQAAAAEEPLTLSQEVTMLERAMALSRQEAEAAAEVWEALQALEAREEREAREAREVLTPSARLIPVAPMQSRAIKSPASSECNQGQSRATKAPASSECNQWKSMAIKAPASSEWACACCTLINAASTMRCAMCDAMRGSLLPAATTLAAQGWAPCGAPSKVRGGGGTCAAGGRGGRGAGSKASASARKPSAGGAGSLAKWVHHREGLGPVSGSASSGLEFSGKKQ